MKPQLLALSGYKGSGKSTVADYLVSAYGYTQISFAAKLKDLVAETYRVPREHLDSPTMKEQPILSLPAIPSDPFTQAIHHMLRDELLSGYWTPRALCILEGSIKRSVNANFWIRDLLAEIQKNPNRSYVISDLRYKSEADIIKMQLPESLTLRIERHLSVATTDPSERDLDDYKFDIRMSNKFTKREDLYRTIDMIFSFNRWV